MSVMKGKRKGSPSERREAGRGSSSQSQDSEYLRQFLGLVTKPFTVRYTPVTWTDEDTSGLHHVASDSGYNETAGDACYARIFGTYRENGQDIPSCNVTQSCWSMMTKSNTAAYVITHQLLYFIIIEKEGCLDVFQGTTQLNVRAVEAELCRYIWREASREARHGKVEDLYQDLFLEQGSLCGMLGFENFMQLDWIRMVLSWQKPSGCFSSHDFSQIMDQAKEEPQQSAGPDQEKEIDQLMRDLQREAHMIEKPYSGRKLLRERFMNDGCLAHKSGLGFAAMSVYTHYLVRQLYLNQPKRE